MFATKTTEKPPSKQGNLLKRGNKGLSTKQMKQRWFALEVNTLSYYKNNRLNNAPLGFISLSQVAAVIPRKEEEEGRFDIKMENEGDKEGRFYYLRAKNQAEMEEWIDVINESKQYYERGGLPSSSSGNTEGNLRLQLQQKEREIEALARSLQLTKDLLEKEKKRSVLILETERAEANKIRDSQKELSAELNAMKNQLSEKEKQLLTFKELVEMSDSKEVVIQQKMSMAKKPDEELKEELECRMEELKEMKDKLKEKKDKIRDLKKQLATANEVFTITNPKLSANLSESQSKSRSVTALSETDSIFLMKEKMAEMKENLEKRIAELQEKFDGQVAENHKLESDAAQWKSMAQKELKARLNLESEKASLQRELSESRKLNESGSKTSKRSQTKSAREASRDNYAVPEYDKEPVTGYQPMIEDVEANTYVAQKGNNPAASPNCWSCSIQ